MADSGFYEEDFLKFLESSSTEYVAYSGQAAHLIRSHPAQAFRSIAPAPSERSDVEPAC